MAYFQHIVKQLDKNDLKILSCLFDHESFNKIQSLNKQKIIQFTNVSDFIFRKTILKLENLSFIEVVKNQKQYQYYLSEFGLQAINHITEKVGI